MAQVFITDRITNPDIEASFLGDRVSLKFDSQAEILLVWRQLVDADFIDQFPKLKAIIRYGIGYERIDISHAKKRNILVCNNPSYCLEEVSDSTLGYIINISRGLTRQDALARHFTDGWQKNSVPVTRQLADTSIGVIGAGNIGSKVISKCIALGMNVIFFDPYLENDKMSELKNSGAKMAIDLKELLNVSDIVTLHVPLTDETNGMVDETFINNMKESSSLINTARGKLFFNLDILHDALKTEKLQSISLDVLPEEPPGFELLLNAWRAREPWLDGRLIITPHKSYLSDKSLVEMRRQVAINALDIINNKSPKINSIISHGQMLNN